ncbi:hypothetical protein SAMN05421538_1039 [Paracoccus isoporae]|uniref:Uncharacterized protein n=1 Tax=Paracoccus isoporae TaxID=591205 RepID=A0A1G6YMN6_9RHOB|nr:hypothetical protein SAMN05421538_1039 [Paracoccus isoporae]
METGRVAGLRRMVRTRGRPPTTRRPGTARRLPPRGGIRRISSRRLQVPRSTRRIRVRRAWPRLRPWRQGLFLACRTASAGRRRAGRSLNALQRLWWMPVGRPGDRPASPGIWRDRGCRVKHPVREPDKRCMRWTSPHSRNRLTQTPIQVHIYLRRSHCAPATGSGPLARQTVSRVPSRSQLPGRCARRQMPGMRSARCRPTIEAMMRKLRQIRRNVPGPSPDPPSPNSLPIAVTPGLPARPPPRGRQRRDRRSIRLSDVNRDQRLRPAPRRRARRRMAARWPMPPRRPTQPPAPASLFPLRPRRPRSQP